MNGAWIDQAPGLRAYLSGPAKGSGPGIVLYHDGAAENSPVLQWADRLAEEGYVVLVPLGSSEAPAGGAAWVANAVAVLRARSHCKGKVGLLGYGSIGKAALEALPALHAIAGAGVDCAVCYGTSDLAGLLSAARRAALPAVIQFAGAPTAAGAAGVASAASAADPAPNGDRCAVELYSYPDAGAAFYMPEYGSPDNAAAAMAYSRTIALFRRVMGPHYDLSALWEAHRNCEFLTRDVDATMATMVAEPYVNHVPTQTGGFGHANLHRFYKNHFIPNNPKDMKNIPISRTIGSDRVVNEGILCFTHDTEIDWMLPGIAPTGKYVEVALVGIITFRGDKLVHEHIYWDQASVLVQIGLLDPTGLPVSGAAAARKVLDPRLPSNELMAKWPDSAG